MAGTGVTGLAATSYDSVGYPFVFTYSTVSIVDETLHYHLYCNQGVGSCVL